MCDLTGWTGEPYVRSKFRFFSKCLLGCAVVVGLVATPVAAASMKPAKKSQDEILYSFVGGADGAYPGSGIIADSSGNFYDTTEEGGKANLGTVFELTANGAESVLYSFAGGASDGALPGASLIADGAGNLYGTTIDGGNGDCGDAGCGTVFELMPGGGESILYSFQGDGDGAGPQASLFMDSAGNLFGTTFAGGSSNCEGGGGTVCELAPAGNGTWAESVLYAFGGGTDGAGPQGGLIEDPAGNLYGTTTSGGPSVHCPGGCGTVFELSPTRVGSWTEAVIHSFKLPHNGGDGAYPASNLMMDVHGNLFGTTPQGGSKACGGGCGVIFELSPSHNGTWTETFPFKFTAGKHGAFPSAGLFRKKRGVFYR